MTLIVANTDRADLLSLAEGIASGQIRSSLADSIVPLTVPDCPHALTRFEQLVEAVIERHSFLSDPDSWLVSHSLPLGSVEAWDTQTEAAVELAVSELVA